MIEAFVPMDKRHDDFYERFMEKRYQTIKNSERPSTEDTLAFPVESLRTAPTAVPRKRTSNTSSDSGVNSPQNISTSTPVVPDCSHTPQHHLKPSTSRCDLPPMSPSKSLTPYQHFLHNSRKFRNKEPKYNQPQPNNHDPQSCASHPHPSRL